MRIVVVNVNTTERITEAIRQQAMKYASPGTDIEAVTPFFGPSAVEDSFGRHMSAVAVMDRVVAIKEPYDAIVEAGFGENGREGLQELVAVPVIGITEAAANVACLLGRKFSVVTTIDRAAAQIEERLLLDGLRPRCVSIRPTGIGVLDIDRDPEAATVAIIAEAKLAVDVDKADVICLGCAGMVDLQERVAKAVSVPVVDGVAAAVKLAEALYGLGLRPFVENPGERLRPGTIGWPLHRFLPPFPPE